MLNDADRSLIDRHSTEKLHRGFQLARLIDD